MSRELAPRSEVIGLTEALDLKTAPKIKYLNARKAGVFPRPPPLRAYRDDIWCLGTARREAASKVPSSLRCGAERATSRNVMADKPNIVAITVRIIDAPL